MTNPKFHVTYVHEKPGVHTGNILWVGEFKMIHGKFPQSHPFPGKAVFFRS